MGASNSEQSRTNYFSLKAKTSDTDPTPFFGKNTKTGNGWEITEKYDSMDGNLTDIEYSTYVYEGETKHKCKLILNDNDGTRNSVESNFNNLLYSLLNSLASCEPGFINMNLSLGKAKIIDGKEGKRYPSIWVKNNGEEVKWKYGAEQLPRPEKIKAGSKTVLDDTKVIEFWTKVIDNEIKPKLKAKPKDASVEAGEPIISPSHLDLPF